MVKAHIHIEIDDGTTYDIGVTCDTEELYYMLLDGLEELKKNPGRPIIIEDNEGFSTKVTGTATDVTVTVL